MKKMILHSLRMHKVQTATIVVSVMLSVAIALTLAFIYGGTTKGMELSAERSGAQIMLIPREADVYLTDTELLYSGVPAPMYMSQDTLERVRSVKGVEAATPQFFSQTLSLSCCSTGTETRLIGVDFSSDFVVQPLLPPGTSVDLAEDQVIVGSRVDGEEDGILRIIGKPYRVVAHMAETGTDMDSSIVTTISNARNISRTTPGYESYWEKYGDPDGLISCILIKADTNADTYEGLRNMLSGISGTSFFEQASSAERAQTQLKSVFTLLAGAAVAMIVVTLMQLFARFYSCVWDRKSELALYRAIGASSNNLRALIGGEIGSIVGIGAVAGVVLGLIVYAVLVSMLLDSLAFPFVPLSPIAMVLSVIGILIALALVAGLAIQWPLRQISRIDPSTAMQQGDID